jgi:hypothetical protein
MAYVPTPTEILQVRMEVQDVEAGLYILPDATYEYILIKNNGSIGRSSIDAARFILMRLSITAVDSVTDCLSIKTSKQVEAYRAALELFIKSPSLNPLVNSAGGWAGNVSKAEMQANNDNPDNYVTDLAKQSNLSIYPDNPFSI